MIRILLLSTLLLAYLTADAQLPATDPYAAYANLIEVFKFQRRWRGDSTVKLPVLFSPKAQPNLLSYGYREPVLKINPQPANMHKRQVLLPVPAGSSGYPVGPSVLWADHLITLFGSGRFGCYRLADFSLNPLLEAQLNVRHWQYKWLIDGQLVAKDDERLWQFSADGQWHLYSMPLPMGMRPLLFNDEKYLVYGSCMGEFGGQALFYNRATGTTSVAEATCPTAVWRDESGGYAIGSALAHMAGTTSLRYVANPQTLPTFRLTGKKLEPIASEIPRPDTTQKSGFKYAEVVLQRVGTWRGQLQFLYYSGGGTVLAVPQGDTLLIVDPLFNSRLRRHGALTQSYGAGELVSYTEPYSARSPETAALLFTEQEVVLLTWKKPESVKKGR